MNLLFRAALYSLVLFLVVIVHISQRHTGAAETLRAAIPKTGRYLLLTLFWVAVMFVAEWLFID